MTAYVLSAHACVLNIHVHVMCVSRCVFACGECARQWCCALLPFTPSPLYNVMYNSIVCLQTCSCIKTHAYNSKQNRGTVSQKDIVEDTKTM